MSEGRVLAGRYELRRVLGRGGMAEVYAAHDRTLDREVAVKLLLDRFREDDAFTRRFNDEARHVARLNHPNLVAVYDTGLDEGQSYIVMELVEGRSLQEAIDAGGLTEDRALEVAADVCAALAYAHGRGLIHRDIKPGNILLADDGTVKVTDFGIARAIGNETVTRTAAVLGTAAYLSPEQAQGREIDPRSDLYSLGVVLYEALTGQQPFSGESAVTVAYQHVQEAPRPPRELDASISPAAEAVTMRALAKNPANRYQDAEEMRADVANARVGRPVAAPAVLTADDTALLQPDPTTRATASHEVQRRRRGIIYALVILLGLLALVSGALALASIIRGGDDVLLVSVPDVVGEVEEEAVAALAADGFVPDVRRVSDDDVEEGRVVSQDPAGGTDAEEGSVVVLQVSTGPELTRVPGIVGLTEEEALAAIREAGLIRGDRQTQPSDEFDAGIVIASDPEEGVEVPLDSTVDYVVSEGEETVRVRPVVNYSEDEALERLRDQGLEVNIEREYSPTVPEGDVISQDPEPGEEVPVGSIVTIVVSRGPEPEPEPEEPDDEDGEEDPDEEDTDA